MKKKILILVAMLAMFICMFAISSSAAGATTDSYGDIKEIGGIATPTEIDSTSRVVLKASDGTYYTFPTYYILEDQEIFCWKQNAEVSAILGYAQSSKNNDFRPYVVRMEIPEGITAINPNNDGGATVFEDSNLMVAVKLPSTLTKIGDHVFNRCYNLATIEGFLEYLNKDTTTTLGNQMVAETLWGEGVDLVIPKNVTSIPERCFYGTKIKSVTFHDDITVLGARAFQGCANITSVKLPPNLQKMESHVFASCASLTSVDTSACTSLESIGNYCFEYSAIKTFDFTPFAAELTSLGDGLFNGCNSLTSVSGYELADGITSIGANMFQSCPLTALKFPKNITSIGSYAFFNHKSQDTVTKIPNGVETIGDHAFVRDKNVAKVNGTVEIYLPASLTTFTGTYNFEYWDFDIMYIPAGLTIAQGVTNGTLDKGVVYYYTGAKDTLNIHETHNDALLNAEWIDVDDFKGASGEKNYIVYGCNPCEIFYDGVHKKAKDANKACEVAFKCTKCYEDIAGHTPVITITYNGKYAVAGVKTVVCSCENAGTYNAAPIFQTLGYAIKKDGRGITNDYKINEIALNEYVAYCEANGKSFEFGIFIGNSETFGETFIKADGTADNGYAFSQKINADGFTKIKCAVADFTADEATLTLVMGLYVIDDGEVSYVQHKGQSEYAGTAKRDGTILDVVTIVKIAELEKVELPFTVPANVPAENKENI